MRAASVSGGRLRFWSANPHLPSVLAFAAYLMVSIPVFGRGVIEDLDDRVVG